MLQQKHCIKLHKIPTFVIINVFFLPTTFLGDKCYLAAKLISRSGSNLFVESQYNFVIILPRFSLKQVYFEDRYRAYMYFDYSPLLTVKPRQMPNF
jgi:hypothetical protein